MELHSFANFSDDDVDVNVAVDVDVEQKQIREIFRSTKKKSRNFRRDNLFYKFCEVLSDARPNGCDHELGRQISIQIDLF